MGGGRRRDCKKKAEKWCLEWTGRVWPAGATAACPESPACSAGCRRRRSCRTEYSTGSTDSGSGNTAATAERTEITQKEESHKIKQSCFRTGFTLERGGEHCLRSSGTL